MHHCGHRAAVGECRSGLLSGTGPTLLSGAGPTLSWSHVRKSNVAQLKAPINEHNSAHCIETAPLNARKKRMGMMLPPFGISALSKKTRGEGPGTKCLGGIVQKGGQQTCLQDGYLVGHLVADLDDASTSTLTLALTLILALTCLWDEDLDGARDHSVGLRRAWHSRSVVWSCREYGVCCTVVACAVR